MPGTSAFWTGDGCVGVLHQVTGLSENKHGPSAFAVSYFVSHSNITSKFVVSIEDGEKREWTKHYTGERFLKGKPRIHHGSQWPRFWGRGPDGVENALVKLMLAKEKGFLSEEEYEKVMSVLIGPMLGVEKEKHE
jgi:hypothetical protein